MNKTHTPSQSSCKELHTLLEARGEVMETEFVYCHDDLIPSMNVVIQTKDSEVYPAPLATEILERLPEYLKLNVSHITLTCDFSKGNSSTYYFSPSSPVGFRYHHLQNAPTLAQAVTDMLIHLIKEELI